MATHATCSLCGRAAAGDLVDPGPALGIVHRACFNRWDREAEAFERLQVDIPYQGRTVVPRPRRRAHRRVRQLEVSCG